MMAGVYRSEVRFYTEIADTVDVRAPACFYAEMSTDPDRPGDFTLLLEDLAPRRQGDQIAGCTVEQARDAVLNLAGLHAPRWCDPTLLDVEGLQVNGPTTPRCSPSSTAPPSTCSSTGWARWSPRPTPPPSARPCR